MLSTATKIRMARVIYRGVQILRRPLGLGPLAAVRRDGISWELDLREGIDLTIYLVGVFERDTLSALESIVPRGSLVVDVGANIGAHTLHLARMVAPSGRVLAVEPTDFAFKKLRRNVAANPGFSGCVDAVQAFLAARPEETAQSAVPSSWPVDGRNPDNEKMGSRMMSANGALTTTLDALTSERAPQRKVAVVKMDVDGHELEVLQGAECLLREHRPVIVMELAPYVFEPVTKFDRMVELLRDAGYGFHSLNGASLPGDPSGLRTHIPENGSINVVARPRPLR